MLWYNYVAAFFAGAIFANAMPHFVQGVSGNRFPTPFAKPPGRGLSSPLVNVIWALLNFVIGCVVLHFGGACCGGWLAGLVFFAGFACLSVFSSVNFAKKDRE